ncbi:MAG: hypothetical protein G01um101472_557 [Parcubacteria group bacterium Gr01-1014_72]|nr:MAG: hypothetical protein G01um101472_557 [Parcubacteria group bacterium Gr01-1014_72]
MRTLFPIALILLSVGVFFWLIQPNRAEIARLNGVREDLARAAERARELQEVQDKLLAEDQKISDTEREDIVKLLPDNVDNVRLIIDIDGLAARYSARVKNVEVTTGSASDSSSAALATGPEQYGSIGLAFTVSTTYENFLDFLKDLERSLRLVDVTALTFASSKKDQYEYNVSIKTYWLK